MTSNVSFRVLVDNKQHAPGLETEHGLALWVEAGGMRILFDTGQSDMVVRNASRLGVPLERTDILVLSHGHYDHTGGLAYLDPILPSNTRIFAHPDVPAERFSRHSDGSIRAIGMPEPSREVFDRRKKHFSPVTAPVKIAADVSLTGPVPRLSGFEDTGGDFWLDQDCLVPDPIVDDMALWIEADEGVWIFFGCAHSGIVNTVKYIQSISRRPTVHAAIGGTHLKKSSRERLKKTAEFMNGLQPAILLPCHCSGDNIKAVLASISDPCLLDAEDAKQLKDTR